LKKFKIIIFPIGEHDVAGNKRLSNLTSYLGLSNEIDIKILKIYNERAKNIKSTIVKTIIKLLFSFINFFQVIYILINEKKTGFINVVYFYEGNHIFLHRIAISKLLGYKIFIDLVENPNCLSYVKSYTQRVRTIYFLFIYRFIPYFADGIIVVSRYLKHMIENDFNNRVPVFLMSVSYDPINFSNANFDYPFPSIFYGGSYGSNYDFESLFKAFNLAVEKFPKLTLYLSGKLDRRTVEMIKANISKKENIVILGYLNEEDYFKVICGMNILCMPRNNSIQANAGFPFKLAEYLATGRPVITSKVSDVADYVTENDAFIYEPGDYLKIEFFIRQILSRYEESLVIGNNGKEKAEFFFNSRKLASDFHSFILSLNL
jgi:glycosyltransferase involved in cell wall biosynthesis